MCSSALFVQLTTDLKQHTSFMHVSFLLASMHTHTQMVVSFYIPYISWPACTCTDVCYTMQMNVPLLLLLFACHEILLLLRLVVRNKLPLMDDPYTSSLPQTLHAFFHCSRTKWASQLAGSRKVQNVHISQFGKCKYIKTVVDLSSCVCCQFFTVLEIYTDLQYFWVRPNPVHWANKCCPCTIANSISLDPWAKCSTYI